MGLFTIKGKLNFWSWKSFYILQVLFYAKYSAIYDKLVL